MSNEIRVGDVVFLRRFKNKELGTIRRITPKRVLIAVQKRDKYCRYGRRGEVWRKKTEVELLEVVTLDKPCSCGENEWQLVSDGVDSKIHRCRYCGNQRLSWTRGPLAPQRR